MEIIEKPIKQHNQCKEIAAHDEQSYALLIVTAMLTLTLHVHTSFLLGLFNLYSI